MHTITPTDASELPSGIHNESDENLFYISVVKDILLWIEHNLDKSLQLDVVAGRAGYTKWYFQRIFKRFTGMTLAGYIRRRRLTKAATELRLSSKNIGDIAMKYQFDSQQSFARRFKAVFQMTPSQYRHDINWDLTMLQPPLQLEMPELPEPEIVELPAVSIYQKRYHYQTPLTEIGKLHETIRRTFWQDFLRLVSPDIQTCCIQIDYDTLPDKPETVAVTYTLGVDNTDLIRVENALEPALFPGGKFAKFHFDGTFDEYREFSFNVYLYALPQLGLCRRPVGDIEVIHNHHKECPADPPKRMQLDYYVPVL